MSTLRLCLCDSTTTRRLLDWRIYLRIDPDRSHRQSDCQPWFENTTRSIDEGWRHVRGVEGMLELICNWQWISHDGSLAMWPLQRLLYNCIDVEVASPNTQPRSLARYHPCSLPPFDIETSDYKLGCRKSTTDPLFQIAINTQQLNLFHHHHHDLESSDSD